MNLASETIRVLQRFKNAVLEGPPGTGKTFVVENIASEWSAATGRPLAGTGTGQFAITLHPSTTYEEFVDGLRFDEAQDKFVRKPGFLLRVIAEAEANPDSDYLVLIDEINRANVPKVLGDVLLCMESSKRTRYVGGAWEGGIKVTLPYSGEIFSIPDNVYLLGTMNSSDRSIAPLDSALRRRFGFIRADPIMGDPLRDAIEAAEGEEARDRASRSIDELLNLNQILLHTLGPDAVLGHSYLFGWSTLDAPAPAADDPLAAVREAAAQAGSTRIMWLEVRKMWGGSENQLDIPDVRQGKRGLVQSFYPMSSNGSTTDKRSGNGSQDKFDFHWNGVTLSENSIEYNDGGNNVRMKYKGRTADNRGLTSFAQPGTLTQKIHVWLVRPDSTFDFLVLDLTDDNVLALEGVSDWTERTQASGGRTYGQLDLEKLKGTATAPTRTADEDAEWLTWRYSILPQLVDTLTQLGATDLFDPTLRQDWLDANVVNGAEERLTQFDTFLGSLRLTLSEQGYGLSKALIIGELPVGAEAAAETVEAGPDSDDSLQLEEADDSADVLQV